MSVKSKNDVAFPSVGDDNLQFEDKQAKKKKKSGGFQSMGNSIENVDSLDLQPGTFKGIMKLGYKVSQFYQ